MPLANMHIGVNGPAVESENLVIEEHIEGSPRGQLLGELSPGKIVDLGLPAVFEADDYGHALSLKSRGGQSWHR